MNAPSQTEDSPTKPIVLETGDRLTRDEFERRYEALPEIKKAELLEGVVYVASPVRFELHGEQHFNLAAWLGYYRSQTPGTRGGDNTTLRLDADNEPQPDLLLCIDPQRGGKVSVVEKYLEGAPELVAEVASSSVSLDLGVKFQVYRRNGVQEYTIWRVLDEAIDWFRLRKGAYVPLETTDGILRSEIFPGLWLDPKALLAGDMKRVLAVVDQGIAAPEHGRFLAAEV
jgi:Uma2 family endonuclease